MRNRISSPLPQTNVSTVLPTSLEYLIIILLLYGFLDKEMELELPQMNYLVKKLIGCCIRSTYYLFCTKDKQWVTPKFLYWE